MLEIFLLAMPDYLCERPDYIRAMRRLARTCRRWRAIVEGYSDLWADFCLNPCRLVSDVVEWTSHFALPGLPLDIRLRFDDFFPLLYPASTPHAPRLSMEGTLAAIEPHIHRCRRLFIAADQIAYPPVVSMLQQMDARLLVSLTLCSVVLPFLSPPTHYAARNPRLFLPFGAPCLEYLRLVSASVGWKNLALYGGLRVLAITTIPEFLRPTGSQLWRMFERMQKVARLSLRDISCSPLDFLFHGIVTLPCLVELDIRFRGSVNLAMLLSRVQAPSLHIVTTFIDTPDDLDCLMTCGSLFTSITSFAVSCTIRMDRMRLAELFESMPLLEVLDLSHATSEFFEALFAPGLPFFFPYLRELHLFDVVPTMIRVYLRRRMIASISLQLVSLVRADEAWFAPDLEWIRNELGSGNLIVNPTADHSRRSWLYHY
jgi:hypothetical protein